MQEGSIRPMSSYTDAALCVNLAMRVITSSEAYSRYKVSEDKIRSVAVACVSTDNADYAGFVNDNCTAFIVGYVHPLYFSDDLIADEILFARDVAQRVRPRELVWLYEAFEHWARARGAIELRTGNTLGIADRDGLARFYTKRLGFELLGDTYRKEL